jgi:Undecaprenyl-phosphate glucose phosphotransferase
MFRLCRGYQVHSQASAVVNQHIKTADVQSPSWNRRWVMGRLGFTMALLVAEALLIVTTAVLTGIAYHVVGYSDPGEIVYYAAVGGMTALLFTAPLLFRDELKFQDYLDGKRSPARTFMMWNYAFLCLALIGFMTKTTGGFSRAWLTVFYGVGLVAVITLDAAVGRIVRAALAQGRIATRRLMLIGAESDITRMSHAIDTPHGAFRIVATATLPSGSLGDGQDRHHLLTEAVDRARALGAEDVVIVTDWSRGELIQDLVEAFAVLPVSVHLGASGIIGGFSDARLARFGQTQALSVSGPPLSPLQEATKRVFDLLVAFVALVMLAPVLLAIGLLVKFDSPGPMFFRQRRRGYNLQEFRIWKFRTMTTMDDGPVIQQATHDDVRVTRVGAILRRLNLDELPQLINVVIGEMSLVGPRPHAVAHDELFETRIAKYRRRLNVRPGITGWAQVNGHRGPTETDAAMRDRVLHDLYYIDHWSIPLDLYILVATVVSRKAFRNAH